MVFKNGKRLKSAVSKAKHYVSAEETHKRRMSRLNKKFDKASRQREIADLQAKVERTKPKKKGGIIKAVGKVIQVIEGQPQKKSRSSNGGSFGFGMDDFALGSPKRKGKKRKDDYWGFM